MPPTPLLRHHAALETTHQRAVDDTSPCVYRLDDLNFRRPGEDCSLEPLLEVSGGAEAAGEDDGGDGFALRLECEDLFPHQRDDFVDNGVEDGAHVGDGHCVVGVGDAEEVGVGESRDLDLDGCVGVAGEAEGAFGALEGGKHLCPREGLHGVDSGGAEGAADVAEEVLVEVD